MDEHHDSQKALQYWRAACDERERAGLSKQIQVKYQTIRFQVSLSFLQGCILFVLLCLLFRMGCLLYLLGCITFGLFHILPGVPYHPSKSLSKFNILCIQLPKKQFRYASEFTSRAELEALALDLDSLRLQSLIICERILGTQHKVEVV